MGLRSAGTPLAGTLEAGLRAGRTSLALKGEGEGHNRAGRRAEGQRGQRRAAERAEAVETAAAARPGTLPEAQAELVPSKNLGGNSEAAGR